MEVIYITTKLTPGGNVPQAVGLEPQPLHYGKGTLPTSGEGLRPSHLLGWQPRDGFRPLVQG